jgi:hypothetical protein
MARRRVGLKLTKRFWRLVVAIAAVCILGGVIVWTLHVVSLPDINAEATVPVILETKKATAQCVLAAWQPEKATVNIGMGRPVATLSTSFRWARFAQVQGTGSLNQADRSSDRPIVLSENGTSEHTRYQLNRYEQAAPAQAGSCARPEGSR